MPKSMLIFLFASAIFATSRGFYHRRNWQRRPQALAGRAVGEGRAVGDTSHFETHSSVFTGSGSDYDLETFVKNSGGASGTGASTYDSVAETSVNNGRHAMFGSSAYSYGDSTSVAGANIAETTPHRSRGASSAGSACAANGRCRTGTKVTGRNEHNGVALSSNAAGRGQIMTGTSQSGVGITGRGIQGKTRAGGNCRGKGRCAVETGARFRSGRK